MKSDATTVREHLAGVPEDRRATLVQLRKLILKHLPKGYEEAIQWGGISYHVPLRVYPDTYNGKPLCYAAIASQMT